MKIKTVIFDLDGTLLYTIEDLCDSVNFALERYGFPKITVEMCTSFVGCGVANLIMRSCPEGTDDETLSLCLSVFKENYKNNMQNKTRPYDGILEMLSSLKEKGIKTAVLSNKFDEATKSLCCDFFGDLIDLPIGESKTVARKPSTDGIFKILDEFGCSTDEALYVGDSDTDMITAKNANVYAIGVSWGYREVELLQKNGADAVVDTPKEITALALGII